MPINILKDLFVRPYKRQGRSEFEESDRSYLDKELQSIEETVSDLSDAAIQIADNAPQNPRRGMVRIAIAPWDPGDGSDRGYFYDGVDWTVLDAFALAAANTAQAAADAAQTSADAAQATADANASAITTLNNTVTTQGTSITANASAITALDTRLTTAEGNITANASAITTLQSDVSTNGTNITANASSITSLESRVTGTLVNEFINHEDNGIAWGNDTGVNPHATADVYSGTYALELGSTAAQWADIWDLDDASVEMADGWPEPQPGEAWTLGFWYKNTDSAAKLVGFVGGSGDDFLTISLDANTTTWTWKQVSSSALDASFNGRRFELRSTPLTGGTYLRIDGITLVRGVHTLDGSEVIPYSSYAAATQELSTSITSVEGDITSIHARYSVKLDVNGYITGLQLLNDGTSGDFLIMADQFKIVDPAGGASQTGDIPFEIVSGTTYIKSAMIQDASITNAKISALQIDKLTAGDLGVVMDLGSSGVIRMQSGTTGYDENGVWIGDDGGTYKMSIRNGTHYLNFDGTTIEASGDFLNRRSTSDNAYTAQHIIAENTETANVPDTTFVKLKNIYLTRKGDVRIGLELKNEAAPTHTTAPGYYIKQGATTLLSTQTHDGGNTYIWYYHKLTDLDPDAGPLEIWVRGGYKSGDKWSKLRGTRIMTDKPLVDYITPAAALYPEITY